VITAWLNLPFIGIFAVLVVVYGLTATAIAWLTFRSPLCERIRSCSGVSPSFFASVAVLFALLTGFLAGDVIDRNKQAVRAVQAESSALANLIALTRASPNDIVTVREAMRDYVDSVVNDEWEQMAIERPSPKTDAAFAALLRSIADPAVATAAGRAVHDEMINISLQEAAARSDRLALSSYQSDDVKWTTVLFLCLMTQIAIGAVHLERVRAHVAALTIFTIAAIVSLGLIAIQEDPFNGAVTVSPLPLAKVLKTLTP
jgi:hypothetical protein